MWIWLRRLGCGLSFVALSGCAHLTTYNHTVAASLTEPEKSFVDAKQRMIVTVPVWKEYPTTDGKGEYRRVLRVCAEPSPDALSALATSGSGSLSAKDKLTLQAAFNLAETASNIGLRTQTIQLMRDAMYRLCEAAASDNLTSAQFETLQRRFQNSMVAIVAIEQLTGTVRAANVQLSTSASLGSAKEIATLTQNAVDARDKSVAADKTAADKKDAVTKADKAATAYADGKDAEALKTDKAYLALQDTLTKAKADQTTADAAAADAKEKLAVYQTGLKAIGNGNLTAGGTATSSGGSGSAIEASSSAVVASAVKDIVSQQLELGFMREACATYFVSTIDSRIDGAKDQAADTAAAKNTNFAGQCLRYAQESTASLTTGNNLAAAYAAAIQQLVAAKAIKTPEQLVAITAAANAAGVKPVIVAPAMMAR